MVSAVPTPIDGRAGWRSRGGFLRSLVIYRRPGEAGKRRRFYRSLIEADSLCFDIGAHLGNHSAAWLALGARVVAVEPQPLFAASLRKRFAKDSRISIVEKAVSSSSGTAAMAISDGTPTVSTLSNAWRSSLETVRSFRTVRWNRSLDVETTTLDDLIGHFGEPSFCKLDVEGSETAVLRGLGTALSQLSFEVTPGADGMANDCVEHLKKLGTYEFNASIGETARLALADWVDAESIRVWLESLPAARRPVDILARLRH